MGGANQTSAKDFIILGFSDFPQLQIPLFVGLLLIYLMTLAGNLLIMVIVYHNTNLHTPMYFFLTNLSFIDVTYTTIIFPKMLADILLENTHISLSQCLLQIFFFLTMVSTELLLLSVMAYDRYMAICNPLRYVHIMNLGVCKRLAAGIWVVSFMNALPHTVLVSMLSFCESRTINHFFCDVTALINLSCSSTRTIETAGYVLGAINGLLPFFLIITSYINIISTVLRIKSTRGRQKAFSTCASHLTVVILFYGSVCSTYMSPKSTRSMSSNKLISLSYIAITPLCNPIIYSLKNTEIKNALSKASNKHNI